MVYTIKEGYHRSTWIPQLWFFKKLHKYSAAFDYNCWHERDDIEFTGINKLCGFSMPIHAEQPFGKWPVVKHIVNSVVIGWMPNFEREDVINLYVITDNNGVEKRVLVGSVLTLEPFSIVIKILKGKCEVTIINGHEDTIHKEEYRMNTLFRFGYKLFPFFGGKSEAPNDMKILLYG